ncbi:MAG: hypothetical protein Ta2B_21710 [Termitinemataceae bacterium]|nr:MAG: hypothetical protein Ta2B_21710 [Termitinemataceae bacterium]
MILMLGDSTVGHMSIKSLLESNGYIVRVAKTTDLAAVVLRCQKIDLILLDIELPDDISGIDYLKVLKSQAETKDIPVIMVTSSHTSFDFIGDAAANGAVDYIIKPIAPSNLYEKVQAALSS